MRNLTAIILAGGRGLRLRPMTDEIPKCMVPIQGVPLLGWLLDYLFKQGVDRQIVCTGYKHEVIEKFLAQKAQVEYALTSLADEDASMAERIHKAAKETDSDLLICYGDVLADVSIQALSQVADWNPSSLAVVSVYNARSAFGAVVIENGRVLELLEKPGLPHPINIGFVLVKQSALAFMPPKADMMGWLNALSRKNMLYAYRHYGHHLTVNDQAQLEEAEKAEWVQGL